MRGRTTVETRRTIPRLSTCSEHLSQVAAFTIDFYPKLQKKERHLCRGMMLTVTDQNTPKPKRMPSSHLSALITPKKQSHPTVATLTPLFQRPPEWHRHRFSLPAPQIYCISEKSHLASHLRMDVDFRSTASVPCGEQHSAPGPIG